MSNYPADDKGFCIHCLETANSPETLIHKTDCKVWKEFVENGKGEIAEFFRVLEKGKN